jgi:hypothetical protein
MQALKGTRRKKSRLLLNWKIMSAAADLSARAGWQVENFLPINRRETYIDTITKQITGCNDKF